MDYSLKLKENSSCAGPNYDKLFFFHFVQMFIQLFSIRFGYMCMCLIFFPFGWSHCLPIYTKSIDEQIDFLRICNLCFDYNQQWIACFWQRCALKLSHIIVQCDNQTLAQTDEVDVNSTLWQLSHTIELNIIWTFFSKF